MTSLVSRFAHQGSEEPREPRRTTGRSPLPAPLPGWPETSPKALPIPAGGDRFFCPFLALVAVAGLSGETGTSAPITQSPCTSIPSRGSKIFGKKTVDNGDIGNNNWNLFAAFS